MKYFIITGEISGDLHASNLMKSIIAHDPQAQFKYYGGDKMKEVYPEGLILHIKELAVMGIFEVFSKIISLIKRFKKCINEIIDFQPDVVILVDYGGFNLRIAKLIKKKLKVPIYYFIPPKVWAWGLNRVYKIQKYVDKVYSILPFEVDFFKNYKIDVVYFGNPLVKEVNNFKNSYKESKDSFLKRNNLDDKPIIALLPGSRKQEIELCLPEMLKTVKEFSKYQPVIAGISSLKDLYKINDLNNVKIVYDQTYSLLYHSYAAIVTSGTATLETALFKVPQVVIYMTSNLSYYFGRLLIFLGYINVKYFSLPNLIAGEEIVKELLQYKVKESLIDEFVNITECEEIRIRILKDYEKIIEILGDKDVYENISFDIIKLKK